MKTKHLLKICLSAIFCIALLIPNNVLAFASQSQVANQTNNYENISSDAIDQYLINAGYSAEFINSIDSVVKSKLYNGQYSFESEDTVYGILTEDYNIQYSLNENGAICINDSDVQSLKKLVQQENVVNKILQEKTLSANTTAYFTSQISADDVKNMSISAVLQSLSNWSASIICSHRAYGNGIAKKYLTYSWKWSYAPVWTLKDKVAMAWSGNFTAEPESIYWTYKKNVGFTGTQVHTDYISESGYGYDDYNPNAGCGVDIDIKGTITGTYNRYHSGTLSAELTKATSSLTRESAIGRYYHKKIINGLSLSFSASGPSISVTSGSNYDQSSDSAVAFWSTKK